MTIVEDMPGYLCQVHEMPNRSQTQNTKCEVRPLRAAAKRKRKVKQQNDAQKREKPTGKLWAQNMAKLRQGPSQKCFRLKLAPLRSQTQQTHTHTKAFINFCLKFKKIFFLVFLTSCIF